MRLRPLFVLAGVLLALGLGFWFRPDPETDPGTATAPTARPAAPAPGASDQSARPDLVPPLGPGLPPIAPAAAEPPAFNPADFPIAAPLNAPGSTITRDLAILQELFDAWRTNFPHEGNPVGENADITTALLGNNRLGLALIPRRHPALNERGELCDRWGTPFRFHQLSGERMEIISAGPDRRFATADDAVITPP